MKSGPFLSIPNFIKSKLLCCIFGIILYPLPRGKCKRDSQKGKKREISAARCDFSEKLCPSYPPTPLVAGGNFPYTTSCHIFRCIRRCGVSQFFPEKEFFHEKSADSSAVPRDALLPRRLRAERRRFDRRRAVHARLRLCRLHAHRSRDGRALRDQPAALQRPDRARRQ